VTAIEVDFKNSPRCLSAQRRSYYGGVNGSKPISLGDSQQLVEEARNDCDAMQLRLRVVIQLITFGLRHASIYIIELI
jgi:hypothetical protein